MDPEVTAASESFPATVMAEALATLQKQPHLPLAELHALANRVFSVWGSRPQALYELLGDRLLKAGAPLLAYDVVATGLREYASVRLRQLEGLALARAGATPLARERLEALCAEQRDSESVSLLARCYKDLWQQATTADGAADCLEHAQALYLEGYRLGGSPEARFYAGINAATLTLCAGDEETARQLARDVERICRQQLGVHSDYWTFATLGEAALLQRHWPGAEGFYTTAVALAGSDFGSISTMHRQVQVVLRALHEPAERLEGCFNLPDVVVFAGHLVDRPGRPQPRFPAVLEDQIRQRIAEWLQGCGAQIGYSSAGCGGDILFLEEMQKRGAETQVVLPFPEDDFQRSSVAVSPAGDWAARFRTVLARAAHVHTASTQYVPDSAMEFEYTNLLLDGMAKLHARQLGTNVRALLVWDGRPGDGPGGTASLAAHWGQQGLRFAQINPTELLAGGAGPAVTPAAPPRPAAAPPEDQELIAIVFADVVGYRRLTPAQMTLVQAGLMGDIARLLDRHQAQARNAWGDGVHAVFGRLGDAAEFALDLSDLLARTDWAAQGLPADLLMRIALHAGPAKRTVARVTGQHTFIGTHVNLTAYLEPVAMKGQVYATEAFAALATARNEDRYRFEYRGLLSLAKDYGRVRAYRVVRQPPDAIL